MQEELFDGKYYRDAGTQIALDHAGEPWHDRAIEIALLRFKAAGREGCLFEKVRMYAMEVGLEPPPSHKAWGAVCLHLSKAKKIERTGEYRASEDVRSHAHYSPVWRLKEPHGN
jgi:hypothetical protein